MRRPAAMAARPYERATKELGQDSESLGEFA